eukprot:309593_1
MDTADAVQLEVDKDENEFDNEDGRTSVYKTKSEEMLHAHGVEEDMLKELKFARCIVRQPCLLCWGILILLFIISYIDGLVFELSDQSNRTFLVEGNVYVDAFDAYELAAQFVADNSDVNSTDILPQTEVQDFWLYQIFFKDKDYAGDFDINNPEDTNYWILTPENIEKIIKYEDG